MPDGRIKGLAEELIAAHQTRFGDPNREAGRVARYLRGEHDMPYTPRGARDEYRSLARKAVTPWLPLVSETYVKGLFVDGYRPARADENARPWEYWQANRMDARQTIAHRGAVDFGTAYVRVSKANPSPLIRPLAATKTVAEFEDGDDEWPIHGLYVKGRSADGAQLYELFDRTDVHLLAAQSGKALRVVRSDPHGMGVCPLVRFRDRLDGEARGIIEPLIVIQDRINEAVFSLLVALQYASFRQRWATGLAIPVDECPYVDAAGRPTELPTSPDGAAHRANPNFGQPIEPFHAAVDRLWVSDSPDSKFGDFAQTDVTGHLETYGSSVRTLAAVAQLSPHVLLGDLVNLSADALAAAEASTQRKIGEYETIFGESWEQVLRLAARAAGDEESARDLSAQVRWRDTEARSLAAAVDALGKMVQMLGVPAEGAWERIPGVTSTDIQRWRELVRNGDGISQLAEALTRQSQPAIGAANVDPVS